MLTAAPKKFDRYLLPVFPLLDIVAAVGWGLLLETVLRRRMKLAWMLVALATFVFGLGGDWASRPYYLSYYNPLFGGASVGYDTLLTGWGEGLDQVANYLDGVDLGHEPRVRMQSFQASHPLFRADVYNIGHRSVLYPDYYVLYRSHVQRDHSDWVTDHFAFATPRIRGAYQWPRVRLGLPQ